MLPGNRVIDIFSDHFSFHPVNKCNSLKDRIQKLDNLAIELSGVLTQALIITDNSVKNNITTSISYIHIHDKLIIKTLYHASNIMSTETELFAIRCGINQATNSENISRIIVIIDSFHARKKSLILCCISSNLTPCLSSMNFKFSFLIVRKIQSNFGNTQIIISSIVMTLS